MSRLDRLRRALVALAALHSAAVGVGLVFLPDATARFAGFPPVEPAFFARQGGAFHLVLAAGYWLEHRLHGTVWLLLLAKSAAALFLGAAVAGGEPAWSVRAALLGDAAMALGALWLRPRDG